MEGRLLLAASVLPKVVAVEYDTGSPIAVGHVKYVVVRFDADVGGSLSVADVHVRNVSAGADVAPASLTWDAASKSAVITFASSVLADGNYTLSVSGSGVSDADGNLLDGDGDGLPGGDAIRWIPVLAGDATDDGVVNFDDLLRLAKNYSAVGVTRTGGDFNSDRLVNFDDLLILAKNYNHVLGRSIRIAGPTEGSHVVGGVTLIADPSSSVGLAGVQFMVNGQPVGAEDTTAPYTLTWDSTGVDNVK
jgi:hypothetical protein